MQYVTYGVTLFPRMLLVLLMQYVTYCVTFIINAILLFTEGTYTTLLLCCCHILISYIFLFIMHYIILLYCTRSTRIHSFMSTPIFLVTLLVPINVPDPEEKLVWLNGWDYTIVESSFAVYKICRVEVFYSNREALKTYIETTINNVNTSILAIPSEIDDSIPLFLVGEH
jgi:cell division protein FtsW (lipid II flippase)